MRSTISKCWCGGRHHDPITTQGPSRFATSGVSRIPRPSAISSPTPGCPRKSPSAWPTRSRTTRNKDLMVLAQLRRVGQSGTTTRRRQGQVLLDRNRVGGPTGSRSRTPTKCFPVRGRRGWSAQRSHVSPSWSADHPYVSPLRVRGRGHPVHQVLATKAIVGARPSTPRSSIAVRRPASVPGGHDARTDSARTSLDRHSRSCGESVACRRGRDCHHVGQRIYARSYHERQQLPACRIAFPAITGVSLPAPAWWDYDGQVDCHADTHQQALGAGPSRCKEPCWH